MNGEQGAHLSIGEVLSLLQEDFPDVTISKIRFLESQGLIQPERTASGYRKFFEADIDRLRWILRQQRDHFLPLKVIRKMLDEGVDRLDPGTAPQPTLWTQTVEDEEDEPGAAETPLESASVQPTAEEQRTPVAAEVGAGGGRPRSPSHPAVASAPRAAAAPPPSERRGAPGGGGGTGARSGSEAPTGQAGRSRPPAQGGQGGQGGRGEVGGQGGRPAGPPPAERPRHETPADVVAALQEEPRAVTARGGGAAPGQAPVPDEAPRGAPDDAGGGDDVQLGREELCEAAGIDPGLLAGLEQYGLVVPINRGAEPIFGADAVEVARLAVRYAAHGVEPRHLRMYKVSAEREAGFVEQLALPFLKQRNPAARSQATEMARELTAMGAELHAALLRRELGPRLGG